jgi:hypothetical protein
MKEKLEAILSEQLGIGHEMKQMLYTTSNMVDLYALEAKFDTWDKLVSNILKNGYVQPQLYNMFSGVSYLGNAYDDQNGFKERRKRIEYCLPKKIAHLNTAVAHTQSISSLDLLPIDIDSMVEIISLKNEKKVMKKIFISHSSQDKKKIDPLVDLLGDIGVPHNQIFFTSDSSTGVHLGENIMERLKTELSGDVLALFLLSSNFYSSPVCLCEMGAVWIKSNSHIPILIPPFDFKDTKDVFSGSLGFKLNDKSQLNSFKSKVEEYFKLSPVHLSRWEEKRDEYLEKVNKQLSE